MFSRALARILLALWVAGSTVALDLNAATQVELEALPGIGPTRARAILQSRQRRRFRRVRDLLRVPGVGPRTLRRVRPWVEVKRRKRLGHRGH